MVDSVTPSRRSEIMGRVRSKDTSPEMAVRKMVHSLGYRYRLHRKDLPGRPDLVFPGRGKIIFVHGCFWHRHPGCSLARVPKSRVDFWEAKLNANRERDLQTLKKLEEMGWSCLVIWECEIRESGLRERIKEFLG
ncbi:DNA mismatch endonuclease Vsr [Hahella aquimaris]|uniref:very short patch repair endonuclease n=1 Tax=Hahella sp. HNIBRBA332 TaxID=3015983 RepID=UPI00273BBC04|nr:DNA mismatch endonuclease Vsr [Hahella sp. HNIBRBA332]WLQ13311.1 DNA mismatch endonuclease Vsr [Hahella sp. HNIBRBA332]